MKHVRRQKDQYEKIEFCLRGWFRMHAWSQFMQQQFSKDHILKTRASLWHGDTIAKVLCLRMSSYFF